MVVDITCIILRVREHGGRLVPCSCGANNGHAVQNLPWIWIHLQIDRQPKGQPAYRVSKKHRQAVTGATGHYRAPRARLASS